MANGLAVKDVWVSLCYADLVDYSSKTGLSSGGGGNNVFDSQNDCTVCRSAIIVEGPSSPLASVVR